MVTDDPAPAPHLARRHVRYGWWCLLFFLSLGIVLEGMHGLKIGWYLDVSNETRRLLWRLAHAHGVLVALVNVAFGLCQGHLSPGKGLRLASKLYLAAGLILPAGFLLGGLFVYGGDPWIGVFLVPLGALLLFAAVFLTARSVRS